MAPRHFEILVTESNGLSGDIIYLPAEWFLDLRNADAGVYVEVELINGIVGRVKFTEELAEELRRVGLLPRRR
jgi:hypothetical protein